MARTLTTIAALFATALVAAGPQQTGSPPPAPPAGPPPRLVDPPRILPTVIPDARKNHAREVEEAQRTDAAAESAADAAPEPAPEPEAPAAPEQEAPKPASDRRGSAAVAPSVVANPSSVTPTAGAQPAAGPAAGGIPPKVKLVLSLLAALGMLVGPSVAAMWLLGHPVPSSAE